MNKPKHTPGPWTINDFGRGTIEVNEGPRERLVTMVNDRPEREANARLIAAAPELLEALQVITSLLLDEDPKHVPALMAQKLISKATGGSNE